jgi:FkbM family methyltransferase
MNKVKQCRYGQMVYQPNDLWIGRSLELYGEFSEGEVALFRALLRPGDVALDVGANVGAHTVAVAGLVGPRGRVIAFEPQRLAYYCLCANVALNNLHHVVCHQAAAGRSAGFLVVPDLDPDREQNFGGVELSATAAGRPGQKVPVWRIDDLGLPACRLIKIDVEGMEREVLAGAAETIRRCRPLLYVEDDRRDRSAELRALLHELGYGLHLHRPPYFNPQNVAGSRDNVFGSTISLNLFCHPREAAPPIDPRAFGMTALDAPGVPVPSGVPPLEAARRLHKAGDLTGAEPLYLEAVRLQPGNAQAWYLLGALRATAGRPAEAAEALRTAVAHGPDRADAHNHLGVALAAQGLYAEAAESFRRSLALRPDSAESRHNLGLALREMGRPEDAEAQIAQALYLRPDYAEAHHSLGTVLAGLGRRDEATACYREALRLEPGLVRARQALCQALLEQGRREEVTGVCQEAVRALPGSPEAHADLGRALLSQGRKEEAAAAFGEALRLRPDWAQIHNDLGQTLADLGRRDEAAARFRDAIRLQPGNAAAHSNLGALLRRQGRAEEALVSCREAVRLAPRMPEAHNHLGLALLEMNRLDEGQAALIEALRLAPAFAAAHNNLGVALWRLARLDEAQASYEAALRLRPDFAEAANNLGNTLRDLGRPDEAQVLLDRAIGLDPDYVDAHWNRSLLWLQRGDFARGWPEYEWRWRLRAFTPRAFAQPRWDGGPLGGRTILLHAEQGLGDTLQFVRYAPLVKARGATVVLQVQPPLLRLLAGVPGVDVVLPEKAPLPPFDVQAPLLSLPLLFGTDLACIPADVPYLRAEPALVERWRPRLDALGGFTVGIAWKGSDKNRSDHLRSVPLEAFEALARVPGVRLVSLQKGPAGEQVRAVAERFDVAELPGLDETAGPFVDTAAVLTSLDLVVSCDSAVAHLAGALGVPCWLALARAADWRWLLDRADSPWYPRHRLFRQENPGDWAALFARLADALRQRLTGPSGEGEAQGNWAG